MSMFSKSVVQQRIELLGLSEFAQMTNHFEFEANKSLADIKVVQPQRRTALHKLKGQCYVIGMQALADHIKHIEQMLDNGAEKTAFTHIEILPEQVSNAIIELKHYVANLLEEQSLTTIAHH